jgi:RNA polymerase sigma-70 factor (ECF subfamily)
LPATAAEMFDRHHLAIYRYLLRMTGSREHAEELTQEVFLHVVRSAGTYEERSRERAWLFHSAHNLWFDHTRRERRAVETVLIEHVEPSEPARQALRLSLIQALTLLQDNEREAFVLAEIVGLSYKDIADACSATPAAIRSRIYRARMQLRAALGRADHQQASVTMGKV